jgi:hypothetical protein
VKGWLVLACILLVTCAGSPASINSVYKKGAHYNKMTDDELIDYYGELIEELGACHSMGFGGSSCDKLNVRIAQVKKEIEKRNQKEIPQQKKVEKPKRSLEEDIKILCSSRWPDDYSMQKFCVDKQIKSASNCFELSQKYPEGSEERKIIRKCMTRWYDKDKNVIDFSMSEFCIKKQIEAYRSLY